MIRLLFILIVAALEATVVSLPLAALTGVGLGWPLIFSVVLLGWLSDQVTLRLHARYDRAALLVGALLAAMLLIGGALGVGPLGALGALIPGGPNVFQAYVLLLLALLLYWRGTRIDTRDSATVGSLFSRGAAVAVVSLLLGAISGTGAPLGSALILGHVVGLISLGLLALALAHAQEVAGGQLGGLSWRWLLTLVAAIGVVVASSVAATGLLGGGEATAVAQNMLRLLLLPFALVGGVIAYLFITYLGEPLMGLIQAILARLQGLAPPPPVEQVAAEQQGAAAMATITRLANGATFLLALIPIIILVIAILVLRRRRRPAARSDEERESLGLFASLGGDLRDLLRGLRNPFARPLEGLRAALAALTANDPSTRARRAYVRLLLLLEAREQRRLPAQTPAEFAPAAASAAQAVAPVGRITAAYEQARYNPAGAAPAEAQAAEEALRELGEAPTRGAGTG